MDDNKNFTIDDLYSCLQDKEQKDIMKDLRNNITFDNFMWIFILFILSSFGTDNPISKEKLQEITDKYDELKEQFNRINSDVEKNGEF